MKIHLTFLFVGIYSLAFMQESELEKINISGSLGSSLILEAQELDFVLSSSISSFNSKITSPQGGILEVNRTSQSISSFFVNVGVTKRSKLDFGLGIEYGISRFDEMKSSSIFQVYNGDELNANGLSYINGRVRWSPFSIAPELVFSINSKYALLSGNTAQRLSSEKNYFGLGVSYFGRLNANNSFYLQGDFGFLPQHDREFIIDSNALFSTIPLQSRLSFAGYYIFNAIGGRLFLIPGIVYDGNFQKSIQSGDFFIRSNSLLGSAVLQYQISDAFALTFQHVVPVIFESKVPNVEFISNSLIISSVSVRYLFNTSRRLLIDRARR